MIVVATTEFVVEQRFLYVPWNGKDVVDRNHWQRGGGSPQSFGWSFTTGTGGLNVSIINDGNGFDFRSQGFELWGKKGIYTS